MRVLIVAKTRRGSGACVGGITHEGRSVRLIAADAETNQHAGLEYNVGEVWKIEPTPDPHIIPPHVENIIVLTAHFLKRVENIEQIIHRFMPPVGGGPEKLFDGLLQALPSGALYIAERTGLPLHSTKFWVTDQPLQRDVEGKRIRYRYPMSHGGRTLTFVGFQEPIEIIPAGTLLRVSLAHWWRPTDKPDEELRCHAQLSGWFLPPESSSSSFSSLVLEPKTAGGPRNPIPVRSSPPSGSDRLRTIPALIYRARRVLKQIFGFADFLPLQQQIIARVLQRHDTLVIMPTGGGKSLCYQLPALLLDGLTVVVSPLIALMQDQVSQLHQLAVHAGFLNSTLALREYTRVASRVRSREVRILYVAPETLLRPETLVLLEQSRLACFAVDEAHCISEWGHDFRPEYRQLQLVRARFPQAVCVALTATATRRVRDDIRRLLGIEAAGEFVASFDRPNLFLAVEPRHDGLGQALAFLERHRGRSGIIYCTTRKQVDELATELNARGWPALPYHSGLEAEVRRRHQNEFTRHDATVMVATVAFGMGINKSNVRFVLHYNLPRDIESYYQEIGRAGRDGLPADCLLMHSRADAATIHRFIEEGAAPERAGRQARLEAMIRYAETAGCRRGPLLAYFGETQAITGAGQPTSERGQPSPPVSARGRENAEKAIPAPVDRAQPGCGQCDNCRAEQPPAGLADATEAARKFLTCVQRTGECFGPAHIIDVLLGSRSQRVLARRHHRLSSHGAGVEFSAEEWREFARQFIEQGLAEQDLEFGGLRLTGKGRDVLRGENVFIRRQRTRAVERDPAATRTDCDPESEPTRWLTTKRRFEAVGEAFAAGRSLEELEAHFGVKRETVVQNLQRYCDTGTGHRLDAGRLLQASTLSPADRERVLAELARLGQERLAAVHKALGGAVNYDELHLLRLILKCRE